MNIYHPKFNHWTRFEGKTLKWHSTDSYELYQENMKTKPELMSDYDSESIKYQFNSHGFRCNEFNDKPGIIFLGCSIAQGVGLPLEKTFPFIVSKSLNLECWNLAQAGKSADVGFRILLNYIDRLNVKIVVTDFCMVDRFELLTDSETINFLPSMNSTNEHLLEYFKMYVSTPENAHLNRLRNTLAIRHLCAERDIKFINAGEEIREYVKDSKTSLGRDLLHPGAAYHTNISINVLKKNVASPSGIEPPSIL